MPRYVIAYQKDVISQIAKNAYTDCIITELLEKANVFGSSSMINIYSVPDGADSQTLSLNY